MTFIHTRESEHSMNNGVAVSSLEARRRQPGCQPSDRTRLIGAGYVGWFRLHLDYGKHTNAGNLRHRDDSTRETWVDYLSIKKNAILRQAFLAYL